MVRLKLVLQVEQLPFESVDKVRFRRFSFKKAWFSFEFQLHLINGSRQPMSLLLDLGSISEP